MRVSLDNPKGLVLLIMAAGAGALVYLSYRTVLSPSPFHLFAVEVLAAILLGTVISYRLGFQGDENSLREGGASSSYGVTMLAAVFITSTSLALLFLTSSIYVPELGFFFAVSAAAGSLSAEILATPVLSRTKARWLLAQIVLFGALVGMSFPTLNPTSVISDSYFSWMGVNSIVQTGRIPESLGHFAYFPSFHSLDALTMIIINTGFESFLPINHLVMLATIPFLYLLGELVLTRRQALLTTLLVSLSIFLFLQIEVLPSTMGAVFIALALYCLLKYHRSLNRRWWIFFWCFALFVLLSHPINGLVLAILLGVFTIAKGRNRRIDEAHEVATPAPSFSVIYGGYLVFIAVVAFQTLVQFVLEQGPRWFYARVVAGPVPLLFVLQSVANTIGEAILFVPATIVILAWMISGNKERRFLAIAILVLAAVPASVILAGIGHYGLQAARVLSYLAIFVTIPAGTGVVFLARRPNATPRRIAAAMIVVALVAFTSTTSYLTGNGNRVTSDTISVQPSYVTNSMLASRQFLSEIPDDMPLTLDPWLADFMAPQFALGYLYKPYPIAHTNVVPFDDTFSNRSIGYAVSAVYFSHAGYAAPDANLLQNAAYSLTYNNGVVSVFVPTS